MARATNRKEAKTVGCMEDGLERLIVVVEFRISVNDLKAS